MVINSVVFRSSGQNLTTAGTYTERASHLTEPVLLGLAVLSVRSRVKRRLSPHSKEDSATSHRAPK